MKNGNRSVMVALKNMDWNGICREPKREEDRSKPRKGPFWRKKENTAKHGARLKVGGIVRWRYFTNALGS
jgi:hypothetical protein